MHYGLYYTAFSEGKVTVFVLAAPDFNIVIRQV